MFRSLLAWFIVLVAIFYIVTAPEAAAATARTVGTAIGNAIEALLTFFRGLAD